MYVTELKQQTCFKTSDEKGMFPRISFNIKTALSYGKIHNLNTVQHFLFT